jgi:hypothetical protein
MSMARLVITAVTVEGRSKSEVGPGLRSFPGLGAEAGAPLPAGGPGRVRTPIAATAQQSAGGRSGGGGPDRPAAQDANHEGCERWHGDDRRSSADGRGVAGAGGLDDLADLVAAGECGVLSVCRVAYVCHCAGGWPTVLPTVNRRHSMLTDVGRIVAVPKAVPRTRGLSRHWSPPVGGTRPNSSYAYQCLAAPAGVSGLELVAGVSVAVSAEILVIGGPGPCHVEQDQHKICTGIAPKIAVTRPISRTPHPRRRSHRRDQPMTTEFYD